MYSETVKESDSRTIPMPSEFTVLDQLSEIVNEYLKSNPRMSLNGLSKRCQVSEPTIRRIAKKQIKTLPNISTVLDLLTTISRKQNIKEVVDLYPGPVAEMIRDALPLVDEQESEYSHALNQHLKDPLKYLIFKLSLNSKGVRREKIKSLFGEHGVSELDALVHIGAIHKKGGRYFSQYKSFTGSFENFVEQFRATAGFIKVNKTQGRSSLNPMFVNASESITPEAYKEITKIQRAALRKISQVARDEKNKGDVPMFFLCALDTLDSAAAFEIANGDDSNL